MNMVHDPQVMDYTLPEYLDLSKKIVREVKKLKPVEIAELMEINPQLAQLTYDRFQLWHDNFTPDNSRQAMFAFDGDVYDGLKAYDLTSDEIDYAQDHLRILSGLYGLLKPLDLIQAYRLEMGIPFRFKQWSNLYDFWSLTLTKAVQKSLKMQENQILVNLASVEYFKAIQVKTLKARVIAPAFREFHEGSYKMFSIFGKRARGMMTAWIIKNKITNPKDLIAFDLDGYQYNDQLSLPDKPVFTRG
jgi:uncharacterized protein